MFVDVIIPLAVEGVFTYIVPEPWKTRVAPGGLVVVPFAGHKRYMGVVCRVHERQPEGFEVREIDQVEEEGFSLSEQHLHFLMWMSEYYMAFPGEVVRAALPVAMRLESYTAIAPAGVLPEMPELTAEEQRVMQVLQPGVFLSVAEIEKCLHQKGLLPVVKSLLDRSLVEVQEQVDDLFKPKMEQVVHWARPFSETALNEELDRLRRAPAQYKLLCNWISFTFEEKRETLRKQEFIHRMKTTPAMLSALCAKGILSVSAVEVSRLEQADDITGEIQPLSSDQQEAFNKIEECFREKEVVLLHGVTSSGKTEIYIHLIRNMLEQGKQVFYLLPEIALTVQIVKRLQRVFGDRVGIYHSGMSDRMRVEMWRRQNSENPFPVVLGVRSSVFLPFRNLGLVVVDEEHETSYKQQDPNPRYHGRDSAIMLGSFLGARVLLGSATPSFESYRHAQEGKYGYVHLFRRYGDVSLPELQIADLREPRRKKIMKGSLTPELHQEIQRVLENGDQVILFQNRRGYATYLQCDACGAIPACKHCDVSMTYYKYRGQLSCHYCGSLRPVPAICPDCGKGHYRERTPGTERIEEEVKQYFPEARVARMDLEVMNRKSKLRTLIDRFEARELDVLIGTQMVSKGLDFEGVKLVGVIDADSMIGFPDFRSEERTYQMLTQVSGRSGRKGEQGKVIIQTSDPGNRIFDWTKQGSYPLLYQSLAAERQLFRYPPFFRLIQVELRHADERLLREAANRLAGILRERLKQRVCGPAIPEISRLRGQNRIHILIKTESGLSLSRLKYWLREQSTALTRQGEFKGVRVWFDVDPV